MPAIPEPVAELSVLLYHEIGPQPRPTSNLDCFCTRERFREQMLYLKERGIPVLPADSVCELLLQGGRLAANAAVLTFDDGDTGFLEHALPILAEFGFPATVFAVAGQLGSNAGWVKDPRNAIPLMTASQLQSLAAHGIDVGSHSLSHRKLTELPHSEAARELRDSKALLEDVLGRAVTAFAYPHGRHDASIMRQAESAGYRYAYSTDGDRTIAGEADRFRLPRKYITCNDDLHAFALRLESGHA